MEEDGQMPSERFFHLPEDKKKRIIKASLKEFARVPFEEISINRIIRDADISRGSFYQYFEDKQDLELFLLEDFRDQLQSELEEYLVHEKGDLFQFFQDALGATVRIGMKHEFKDVCKNVFSRLKYGPPCKGDFFKEEVQKMGKKVTGEMKQRYYPEYSIEEIVLVFDILIQIFKEALVRIFLFDEEENKVLEDFHKKTVLIETGMKTVKEKEIEDAQV